MNTFQYTDYRGKYPFPKRTFRGGRVEVPQKGGVATVAVRPYSFRLLLLGK